MEDIVKFRPEPQIAFYWFVLIIPAFYYLEDWGLIFLIPFFIHLLYLWFWEYEIHEDMICEKKGIFSVTYSEVYFYRIKDVRVYEPFFYRIFGLANVTLITSQPLNPTFLIHSLPNAYEFREALKDAILESRKKHGVKEYDIR